MKNNNRKKILVWCALVAVLAIVIATVVFFDRQSNKTTVELSIEQAQELLDKTFTSLPKNVAPIALGVFENSEVTVTSVEYGTEKDIILSCYYETVDIKNVIESNLNDLLSHAYGIFLNNEEQGKKTNATTIMLELSDILEEKMAGAEAIVGETEIFVYQNSDETLKVYLGDETINTCFGGIVEASALIESVSEIEYNGQTVSIKNLNTLRSGLKNCIALTNYDNSRPDTGTPLVKWWNNFVHEFNRNFVEKDQWKYLANGLITTLEITFCAVLIGVFLGFLVAIIRVTYQKTGKLLILDKVCQIYLSIIRGTPVMVQLLIIYFVLLLPIGIEKFPAAVICFGINSGAYVSEIVRGGIMSVDNGQTEAGRSIGFNYTQTMIYIVIPQAFKAVLPALANEFITLLKESSVAFYIGVADLTQGGLKIRSITYSNFMPLIAVALIYLVVVLGLSYCVGLLEKRMHKSDR